VTHQYQQLPLCVPWAARVFQGMRAWVSLFYCLDMTYGRCADEGICTLPWWSWWERLIACISPAATVNLQGSPYQGWIVLLAIEQ
jgi:hypothetical protein